MAPGPIVTKGNRSPVAKMLAGAALLIIVAVLVLTTAPGGCEQRDSIATTSDADTQRELNSRAPAKRIERVTIGGKEFELELAADNPTRMRGLGGRDHIDDNGGMLFAFRVPTTLRFVMRDCLIPIDIIFVDHAGIVTATYTMQPEEPRGENESEFLYENRLKKYSSKFSAQFAIEIQAGQIEKLGVKPGDKIDLDVLRLQMLAQ